MLAANKLKSMSIFLTERGHLKKNKTQEMHKIVTCFILFFF